MLELVAQTRAVKLYHLFVGARPYHKLLFESLQVTSVAHVDAIRTVLYVLESELASRRSILIMIRYVHQRVGHYVSIRIENHRGNAAFENEQQRYVAGVKFGDHDVGKAGALQLFNHLFRSSVLVEVNNV